MLRKLYPLMMLASALTLVGCVQSGPTAEAPYAGYKHTLPEHGYWKEVGGGGGRQIQELHLHKRGFSVTFNPWGTYKDYWGNYSLKDGALVLRVEGGNELPKFKRPIGTLQMQGDKYLTISNIRLDYKRPGQARFKFVRVNPSGR